MLRLTVGPPPPTVQVHAALADHASYFKRTRGEMKATYGDVGRPSFPVVTDAPRLFALGGSTVHGGTKGADFPHEFPHRAGRMLGVQAENLGSPGLDSHDLVRIVDELEGVSATALVVYTGHNDFGNTHFEGRYGTVSSALVARTQALLGRLQLYAQLSRLVRAPTGGARRTRDGMRPSAGEVKPMTPARQRMALGGLRANLQRIAWTTAQRGTPVVLVVPVGRLTQLSGRIPCDRPGCPEELLRAAHDVAESDPERAVELLLAARDADPVGVRAPTAAQELVRDVAAEWDHIVLVDAFAALPRDPVFDVPNRDLFSDVMHLSRRGHTYVGAMVAIALEPLFGVTASLPVDVQAWRAGEAPPPPPPRPDQPSRRGERGPPPPAGQPGPPAGQPRNSSVQ